MQKEKKWWKNFNVYQIVSFCLIILMIIAIIITIGILINKKNKRDAAKRKNDELEDILKDKDETDTSTESIIKNIYLRKIIND